MTTAFAELKKNRNKDIASLTEKIQESKSTKQERVVDERFWTLKLDKGNGAAVIRFLPKPKGEDVPWAKLWNHSFQGPNKMFYIENCLTSLASGTPCPVCAANSALFQTEVEANKNIARGRKRNLVYYSNILVISDDLQPENDGKVFLFKYGLKIFEKIEEVMFPTDKYEPAINPFDFWTGANFRLRAKTVTTTVNGNKATFRDYGTSKFMAVSELFEGNDEKIEAVWNQERSLADFVTRDKFKPYDELEKRFNIVMNATGKVRQNATEVEPDEPKGSLPLSEDNIPDYKPVEQKVTVAETQKVVEHAAEPKKAEGNEDMMKYLQELASGV